MFAPQIAFSQNNVVDLRGTVLPFSDVEIQGDAKQIMFDSTTVFKFPEFKEKLLRNGAIDLDSKESLQQRVVNGADFRNFSFDGYDLFNTQFTNCRMDSLTSFAGAYVISHGQNRTVVNDISLEAKGAISFAPQTLGLHNTTVQADLDFKLVKSLSGSSLLGCDLSLCDLAAFSANESVDFTNCLFNADTKFPSTFRDGNGNVDDTSFAVHLRPGLEAI